MASAKDLAMDHVGKGHFLNAYLPVPYLTNIDFGHNEDMAG